MVVDVDKLSDAELRTKLLEFGFPVMPITGTTRKVMSKKLKMLLENKNKLAGEGGRRSLGRYSSEEESDTEVKVTKKKDNRRATMAAPLMQPPSPPKSKKSTRFNDTIEPEVFTSPVKRDVRTTVTTSRSQKIIRNAQDEFDTGSDSESDITNFQSSKAVSDGRISPLKSSLSSSQYSLPKSTENSYSTSRNISFNPNASPSRISTYNSPSLASPSLASEYATDRLNQIRSRLSLNSPSYDKPSYSSLAATEKEEATPFLSNFTKRLSSLQSQNNDYDYKNDIIKENDVNGSSSYARSQLSRTTRGREPTYDYRANKNNILKNNFVSFAVLAGAALFFVLLAIMYMGMRSDTSVISSDYIVPQCIRNDPASKKFVNCVPEQDVATAIHLLNVIKPELLKRAVAHKCFDPTIKPQMTESEIVNFCLTNFAIKDDRQIRTDLNNLLIMTFNNPEWGLSVAQTEDNNGVVNEKDVAKNMEQVIFNFETKLTSLVILKPLLPWKCTFFNSFYMIINSIVFVVLVFGSLYLLNFGYKYYKHNKQKQKDEIGFMVEKIIDILQMNVNEEGNDNFVVINHVRDMILPVGERQKKASTWAKAVKFINENESRVRTEVQEVKGEPFDVWRWIGNANLSTGNQSEYKYRQGRRIIDPEFLITDVLKFPHKFFKFCQNSEVFLKNEVREGFVSVFVLECSRCKVCYSVCSEEPDSELLSANIAFVAGILSLKLSLYQLNELCNSLRIAGISAESYNHYIDEIYEIYNDSMTENDNSASGNKLFPTYTPKTTGGESKTKKTHQYQGRRIVDPEYLMGQIFKFPHKFLKFCKNSDVSLVDEVQEGFASEFVLECNRCKVQHSVRSEEPDSELLSVNLAFVAGILSLGLSLYQLNELCSSLHIPAVSAENYNRYTDEIYAIYNDSVTESENFMTGSENFTFDNKFLPTSTPKKNGNIDSDHVKRTAFLKSLEKTQNEIEKLAKLTVDQSNESLWHEERRKRVTASNFGRICKLLDSTNRKTVVKELLDPSFKGNIYTEWGKENEQQAREEFEKLVGVSVTNCGLFIHPDYPFLAASPDGLVDHDGLIEIKCPYKSRDVTPEVAIRTNLIKFATMDGGMLKLKRGDKYFYQVQGQLFVTGRKYCYFIVWTPKGLVYEKIVKDEKFLMKMFPKLEEFYFDHMLPSILEKY